ncbi:hypothetical protein EDB85DRAFT_2165498 [Lactarius pseudohatsudake]|nr:hypothetical protein EDB85DRAFT_2165498 [Lactarius pseudohatsudake]
MPIREHLFKSPGALLCTVFTTIPYLNRMGFETLPSVICRASTCLPSPAPFFSQDVSTTKLSDDHTGQCGAALAAPQTSSDRGSTSRRIGIGMNEVWGFEFNHNSPFLTLRRRVVMGHPLGKHGRKKESPLWDLKMS